MVKTDIAIGAMLATLLFGGLGLTALATDNPPVLATVVLPVKTSDTILADKVETILRTDFGLTGSQFRVFSKSGVVTVAGTVQDEHSLRRALDLASGVRGTVAVTNALEIVSPNDVVAE